MDNIFKACLFLGWFGRTIPACGVAKYKRWMSTKAGRAEEREGEAAVAGVQIEGGEEVREGEVPEAGAEKVGEVPEAGAEKVGEVPEAGVEKVGEVPEAGVENRKEEVPEAIIEYKAGEVAEDGAGQSIGEAGAVRGRNRDGEIPVARMGGRSGAEKRAGEGDGGAGRGDIIETTSAASPLLTVIFLAVNHSVPCKSSRQPHYFFKCDCS